MDSGNSKILLDHGFHEIKDSVISWSLEYHEFHENVDFMNSMIPWNLGFQKINNSMRSRIPGDQGFDEIRDVKRSWDKFSCNGELCLYKTFVKHFFL